jgi:hypothetical protein
LTNYTALWSPQLIKCIADRNFVCIVGSGLSVSCTNDRGDHPPGWIGLIHELALDVVPVASQRRAIGALSNKGNLLGAAELLRHYAKQAGRQPDLYTKLAEIVDSPDGHRFQPGPWHDQLLRLDPIVLVTTNYDRILERLTGNGYNLHRPDSKNVDADLRAGTPVLIKAHGTVDQKEDMVLCQTDYARLRREAGHMFDVLGALALTRTCLFLGYGLQDPDINMVMENVMGARGIAPAHYALTSKSQARHLKETLEYAYGVTLVEYKKDDHADGLAALTSLADAVEALRA